MAGKKRRILGLILGLLFLFISLFHHRFEVIGYHYIMSIASIAFLYSFWYFGKRLDFKRHYLDEITQQKEDLQQVIDTVNAVIWSKDVDADTITISAGSELLTGYTCDHFRQKEGLWLKIFHPEDQKQLMEVEQQVLLGHTIRRELRLLNKDEDVVWVDLIASPTLNNDGEVIAINGLVVDISDRKIIESDLLQNEKMYHQLQKSLETFSKDMYKIRKVEELESRLLTEITAILNIKRKAIISIGKANDMSIKANSGEFSNHYFDQIKVVQWGSIKIGELVFLSSLGCLKIGENNGYSIVLCLWDGRLGSKLNDPMIWWLQTIARFTCVLYENLHTIEELVKKIKRQYESENSPPWLLRLLFNLSEKERTNLSQDLHDTVLQNHVLILRQLEDLLIEGSIAQQTEQLKKVRDMILDDIDQIREVCNDLRPPLLYSPDFISVLESLINRLQLRVNFSINITYEKQGIYLGEEITITIYRIVQELIANAVKHSAATKINFECFIKDGQFYLHYADDGKGISPEQFIDDLSTNMGIIGMKKRVQGLNGLITFDSKPNDGLKVHIVCPLEQSNDDELMRSSSLIR